MLSFENVLDCFEPVIQSGICEVLITRHGYVLVPDFHEPAEEEMRMIQKRSAALRLLCDAHGKMTAI